MERCVSIACSPDAYSSGRAYCHTCCSRLICDLTECDVLASFEDPPGVCVFSFISIAVIGEDIETDLFFRIGRTYLKGILKEPDRAQLLRSLFLSDDKHLDFRGNVRIVAARNRKDRRLISSIYCTDSETVIALLPDVDHSVRIGGIGVSSLECV